MNIYIIIAVVMVSSSLFLVGALASPYKPLLLPINIPLKCNFEYSVKLAGSGEGSSALQGGEGPYNIVVLGRDGSEYLRLQPEEAGGILQVVGSDVGGTAMMKWGSLPNSFNFHGDVSEQGSTKSLRVSLAGPFSINNQPSTVQVPAIDKGFGGLMELVGENSEKAIALKEFDWSFSGDSLPIAGGMADAGPWTLTTAPGTQIETVTDQVGQQVTVKYLSIFDSANLYAEDSNDQKRPLVLETTMTGVIVPWPSELASYIQSQIYLQVFGWLAPVAALMVIFWLDSRYRRKIKQMLKSESPELVVQRS